MKKSKIGFIFAYCATFCGVAIFSANQIAEVLGAPEAGEIHHYNAVVANYDHPGCNEYWIECGTNIVSLYEPSGNIVNKGDPSLVQINEMSLYESDGRYIPQITEYEYGSYPQTVVVDNDIISALEGINTVDSKGYKTYLGEKYLKVVSATPNLDGLKFSNGVTIVAGSSYYFKVEPIVWRILSHDSTNNSLFLMSKMSLTKQRFDYDDNNYSTSDLRGWLNGDFYNQIFDATNNVLTTNVDNSDVSTGYISNPYACVATSDKVFLPSVAELSNAAYGFNTNISANDSKRSIKNTDYALTIGAYQYNTGDVANGFTCYRTRSPFYDGSDVVVSISGYGNWGKYPINYSHHGIVPMINLSLN